MIKYDDLSTRNDLTLIILMNRQKIKNDKYKPYSWSSLTTSNCLKKSSWSLYKKKASIQTPINQ